MENLFDLDYQNLHLNEKLVAGLERLAALGRSLLWQQAQAQKVSPIQFQILAFLYGHPQLQPTLTGLTQELGVTKPTVSDAVKSLEQKGLLSRVADGADGRVQHLKLSKTGRKLVTASAGYLAPIAEAIGRQPAADLVAAWKVLSGALAALVDGGVLSPQRMCFSCRHYRWNGSEHYCALLTLVLHEAQIRLDCPEHAPAAT